MPLNEETKPSLFFSFFFFFFLAFHGSVDSAALNQVLPIKKEG